MPNSYFQFKQFTIHQDRCAMKVTTDGCLFGAIVAQELKDMNGPFLLDIGTGTGLLSLMVAQQNETALIDAIEIDAAAAMQANENRAASPWRKRITIRQEDVLLFKPALPYDVIISNPPFYEKQLSSPKKGRNLAHHSSGLTLEQLFTQVKKGLKKDGEFYVLLPYYRADEAISIAKENSLFPHQQWLVKQTTRHDWFRVIFCYGFNPTECIKRELSIKDENNVYSEAFKELLTPYYLKL